MELWLQTILPLCNERDIPNDESLQALNCVSIRCTSCMTECNFTPKLFILQLKYLDNESGSFYVNASTPPLSGKQTSSIENTTSREWAGVFATPFDSLMYTFRVLSAPFSGAFHLTTQWGCRL